MGAGRLAVTAPDRMLARAARRAAVNEIWRGWTGWPARRAFAGGGGLSGRGAGRGAGQDADELGAADPGGVLGGNQFGAGGGEDRAGGGPGAGDGGLGFLQEVFDPLHRQG
jgi:hypothetical protein